MQLRSSRSPLSVINRSGSTPCRAVMIAIAMGATAGIGWGYQLVQSLKSGWSCLVVSGLPQARLSAGSLAGREDWEGRSRGRWRGQNFDMARCCCTTRKKQ